MYIVIAFATGCSTQKSPESATLPATDSSGTAGSMLPATLSVPAEVTLSDSIPLTFAVSNPSDTSRRFLKWHTAFEPWISKYVEVTAENGEEVPYQGAMAKRVMPPPESSYLAVPPKGRVSATVNLMKAFAITRPGKYIIKYVGGTVSGVEVKEEVVLVVK
jgi:hypothetical protein